MAVAATPRRNLRPRTPLRIVTAVPLCDGHDSAIMTINHELVRHGAEVVYLGYHRSAAAIARAAVQEDAHAVGISSYNGGHLVFFREVIRELRRRGGTGIRVFGGGGGTITATDERVMRRYGVERVFFAGTPLEEMVREINGSARSFRPDKSLKGDRSLAREISLLECRAGYPHAAGRDGQTGPAMRRLRGGSLAGAARPASVLANAGVFARRFRTRPTFVLGAAGPGGAGKSTLIDELVFRFLRERPRGRIAVLANDPSHPDSGGALLGDRVSSIYAEDDRVFFRSLATRGSLTGLSAAAPAAVDVLRRSGAFELIIVESVGVGQESDPFGTLARRTLPVADAVLFVTSPHYGGKVQLEKIALLHGSDIVALNKCDDPRATTAKTEIAAALSRNERRPVLCLTTASRHDDVGVDRLYAAISELADIDGAGGERACQLRIHG